MAEENIGGLSDGGNVGGSSSTLVIGSLSSYVGRLNKFLFKADFVTESDLQADITRVATETGLAENNVWKVMESTLKLMEEKRSAAGVDPNKIGEGYAYGGYAVWRPGLMRRRR